MTDFPLTRTTRLYRRLLALLLPPRFHARHAHQMIDLFAELDADVRGTRGSLAAWWSLGSELPGLFEVAARARQVTPSEPHVISSEPHVISSEPHVIPSEARDLLHSPDQQQIPRRFAPRDDKGGKMLDALMQDLRFALRALRRSPGFTAVAVLTLALGIGANTAIFSVVNGVLLRPLPVRDPARVFALGEQQAGSPGQLSTTSPANVYDWQSSSKTMRIAGYYGSGGTVVGTGEPRMLFGIQSVGGIFDVLGLRPLYGRALTVPDEEPASPRVIVLSYETASDLFGAAGQAVGKSITLNGTARTVVGVMAPNYIFLGSRAEFFAPARFDAEFRANRDQYFIAVVGRLSDGATIARANAEMETIAARLRRDWPVFNTNLRILTQPLQDIVVGNAKTQLTVLMGAVAFVLLITCANLGNLLLARASVRRREIAVRQALGAGVGRVARQLLTESMLLALVGGGLGVAVGKLFLKLLMAADAATNLPRSSEVALDGTVLAFTLAVAIGAGLLFGSVPAWQLARGTSHDALRDGARGSAGGVWTRSTLVVAELALAMMLLVGAGLLLRSFDLLRRVQPGIKPERVLTFGVSRPGGDSTNQIFYTRTLERLRALPGVQQVALVSQLPVSGRGIGAWFNRIDKPLPKGVNPTGEAYRVVTPNYFETMGVRLTRGRLIETTDRREAPVVVVNEALAKKYYQGEDPLGKPIYLGAPDNRLFQQGQIVGVVTDTRDAGLGSDPLPTIYIPQAVMPTWPQMSYVIRTSGEPTQVAGAARAVIREIDPKLPVRNLQTMEEVLSQAMAPARWSSTLLGVFAGVALIIAVLGVFGVLSFVVTQRTRELGIRIALGAAPGQVKGMVVKRGLTLAAAGLALGIVGAMVLTRYLGSLLYGVTATDPVTYVGVAALLAAAAVVASYLPARRATRVDPMVALRTE